MAAADSEENSSPFAQIVQRGIMRLTASISHEDTWYVARCLEVEVASQGHTVEESLQNLREALLLYFEDSDALPQPLPEPPIIAPIEVEIPVPA
jgi:predicted RNase H-like HicB family nuclease